MLLITSMLEIPLLLLFAAAAWFDYKERRIPDIITSTAWALIVFLWYFDPFTAVKLIAGAGVTFAGMYFVNNAYRFFAWGDILLFPVYVSYVLLLSPSALTITLPFILLGCYVFFEIARGNKEIKKQNIPLAPFVFLSALILFAAQIAL